MTAFEHIPPPGKSLGILAARLRRAVDPTEGIIDIQTCMDVAEALNRIENNMQESTDSVDQADRQRDCYGQFTPNTDQIRVAFGFNKSTFSDLLSLFICNPGNPLSIDFITSNIGINANSLKVYICQLRIELRKNEISAQITTVRNHGYLMDRRSHELVVRAIKSRIDPTPQLDSGSHNGCDYIYQQLGSWKAAKMLQTLISSANMVCSYESLQISVGVTRKSLAVYASLLRKHLKDHGFPHSIQNISGSGYYLRSNVAKSINTYFKQKSVQRFAQSSIGDCLVTP